MSRGGRVGVVGAKHTTRDLIEGLHRAGHRVDHCITIGPEVAAANDVAGYMDLRPFLASAGIDATLARTYSLRAPEDQEALRALELDLVLVMGWQRLLPAWFLSALPLGAYGMHGASRPLPHGRGRSPLNWSLIQGKTEFYTHLIKYKPGVDDGDVAGVQRFEITPFDDCHTLHLKNTVAMVRLADRLLPRLLDGSVELVPQPTTGATYYPKRTAADGLIDWSLSADRVRDFVRGVTHPFPGAFSFLGDNPEKKVLLWRCIPWDDALAGSTVGPGAIVDVFYDGSFVVATGRGCLLVTDTEGVRLGADDVGRRLGDAGHQRRTWTDLPT